MSDQMPSVGELEMQVMQWIWQLQPCTERQVWDAVCRQRQVGRTTVLKTMQRMVEKGLLERVDQASPVRFRAALKKQRLLPHLVNRFVSNTLAGCPDALVAYFADSGRLTETDLEALQAIADKLKTDPAPDEEQSSE